MAVHPLSGSFYHRRGDLDAIIANPLNALEKGAKGLGGRNLLRNGQNVISFAPYGYPQEKRILAPSS